MELVQCVPNFSEGRRQEVIDALVAACRAPGVALLDHHADPDHNRLVVTFVGDRAAVRAAALQAARAAMALIDMEAHRGSHPRMGALDVLPFVPVRGVTMAECIALAEEVGQALGELGLPVYLYDEAARTPERRSLADVRRGQYEGLRADVAAGRRLPDFGPSDLGRAGATAVGARKPLVAYNVNLGSSDLKVAKAVANRVREARGGLKNVRAIGLDIEGRPVVQVSMNLIDTEATPIYRALELVRLEAARFGAPVVGTEIVGLVPQAALVDSAAYYLQLEGFNPSEQVLENRVTETLLAGGKPEGSGAGTSSEDSSPASGTAQKPQVPMGNLPVNRLLQVLASNAPAPGGGSAAALAGAMAAALIAMVARLSLGKRFAEVAEEMARVAEESDARRRRLEQLIESDTEAFQKVMAAYRLPKETEDEKTARREAIGGALLEAGRIPLETAGTALELIPLGRAVADRGNPNSASDAAAAAHLLGAAVRGALLNVEVNAVSLKALGGEQAAAARELESAGLELRERLEAESPVLIEVCEARVRESA